jgi:SnoaL-like domain
LLIRYCHAIDQHDWDAYRAVYTDDAVIDDVSAGAGNSVDEMVEFLSRALERVVLDELVRTPDGWKISKRAETGYFHNMPPDFRFE